LQFFSGEDRYPLELARNIVGLKKDEVEMVFLEKNKSFNQ